MTRINVHTHDTMGARTGLAGWFNDTTATRYNEATTWDGHNTISAATGSQWDHEQLYRTAGGRWVLHWWSQRTDAPEQYEFVGDDQARQWLLNHNHDSAADEHFGAVADEAGPRPVGRPEIGAAINVRLHDDLLAAIDAEAERTAQTRASTIRTLLASALHH